MYHFRLPYIPIPTQKFIFIFIIMLCYITSHYKHVFNISYIMLLYYLLLYPYLYLFNDNFLSYFTLLLIICSPISFISYYSCHSILFYYTMLYPRFICSVIWPFILSAISLIITYIIHSTYTCFLLYTCLYYIVSHYSYILYIWVMGDYVLHAKSWVQATVFYLCYI